MAALLGGLKETFGRSYDTEIPCLNKDQGCSEMIKPARMKEHLHKECVYHPINCPVLENCPENPIKVKDLEFHLGAGHVVPNYSEKQKGRLTMSQEPPDSSETAVVAKHYDGRVFFVHCRVQKNILLVWASVIGDQSVADKYELAYNFNPLIKIPSPSTKGTYSEFLDVLPIQQSRFAQAHRLGCVGGIEAQYVIQFFKEKQCPFDKIEYTFAFSDQHEFRKK